MKINVKVIELMHLLSQLRDTQSEILLLQSCIGITKLFAGLRTCQPNQMKNEAIWFIKDCQRVNKDIVVGGGPLFSDLKWRVTSLPIGV